MPCGATLNADIDSLSLQLGANFFASLLAISFVSDYTKEFFLASALPDLFFLFPSLVNYLRAL